MAVVFERRYELDWLRVLAFGLLVFYHTGMLFTTWTWHIKNEETSVVFDYVSLFFNRWRLPLLFFVSGAGVFFALTKRTPRQFTKERLTRLLIPIIVGIIVLIPPQIYLERLQQGAVAGVDDFIRSLWEPRWYPRGNLSWHHLWFVAYILIYSLASLPFFLWIRTLSGQRMSSRVASYWSSGYRLYFTLLPLFGIYLLLQPDFPTTNNLLDDWNNFFSSWYLFLVGFFFASEVQLVETAKRLRRLSLVLGLLATVLYFWLWSGDPLREMVPHWKQREGLSIAVSTAVTGCWLLGIIGYARAYLTFSRPFLTYANEAIYPFYILHQSIIIIFGFFVVKWPLSIAGKYILISFVTFLGAWGGYEIIKRNEITRLLFGLRPKKAQRGTNAIPEEKEIFKKSSV